MPNCKRVMDGVYSLKDGSTLAVVGNSDSSLASDEQLCAIAWFLGLSSDARDAAIVSAYRLQSEDVRSYQKFMLLLSRECAARCLSSLSFGEVSPDA